MATITIQRPHSSPSGFDAFSTMIGTTSFCNKAAKVAETNLRLIAFYGKSLGTQEGHEIYKRAQDGLKILGPMRFGFCFMDTFDDLANFIRSVSEGKGYQAFCNGLSLAGDGYGLALDLATYARVEIDKETHGRLKTIGGCLAAASLTFCIANQIKKAADCFDLSITEGKSYQDVKDKPTLAYIAQRHKYKSEVAYDKGINAVLSVVEKITTLAVVIFSLLTASALIVVTPVVSLAVISSLALLGCTFGLVKMFREHFIQREQPLGITDEAANALIVSQALQDAVKRVGDAINGGNDLEHVEKVAYPSAGAGGASASAGTGSAGTGVALPPVPPVPVPAEPAAGVPQPESRADV